MGELDPFYILLIIIAISIWLGSIVDSLKDAKNLRFQLRKKAEECDMQRRENDALRVKNDNLSSNYFAICRERSDLLERKKDLEMKFFASRDECTALKKDYSLLQQEYIRHIENQNTFLTSNTESMPWLAGMMADYLTYDLEVEAKKLEWGSNIQREKKVASIREIRAEAKSRIELAKIAQYQLEYLKQLFPAIDEVLEAEYEELDVGKGIPEHDSVRDYLSKEEWQALTTAERNQLALDRYIKSHSKSKWQIGRDYELAVAYEYSQKGYAIDTFGSYMGLSDMGRDIIAQRGTDVLIIQCKYWAKEKTIHEKHIYQLYGTVVSYCIEHNLELGSVHGVFVTNIELSPVAKSAASMLGVRVAERHPMAEYPRIKCNIGHDANGQIAKIYHLPMDEQYDSTKINSPGECYAFTVAEAEGKGFRRAYKHFR